MNNIFSLMLDLFHMMLKIIKMLPTSKCDPLWILTIRAVKEALPFSYYSVHFIANHIIIFLFIRLSYAKIIYLKNVSPKKNLSK